MKKMMPIIASAGLLLSGLALPVHTVYGADSISPSVESAQPEVISKLTIEDAIDRALSNDRTIILLGYQYELLKLERQMTHDTIDDLEEKIDDAERYGVESTEYGVVSQQIIHSAAIQEAIIGAGFASYDELPMNHAIRGEVDNLTWQTIEGNYAKNAMNEEIAEGIKDTLSPNIDSLRDGLKSNDVNREKNALQVEETKEGIRFMIKGRFIELLTLKESLELQREQIALLEADVRKAEMEYGMGTTSSNNLSLLYRDLKKQEQENTKSQKKYELELKRFLLDLNYTPNLKVELIGPDFEQFEKVDFTKVQEAKEKYLANSFELKRIEQDLEKIEYDRKQIIKKSDDRKEDDKSIDNSNYLVKMKQQELNIKTAEKKKIEEDLTKYITTIYEKAEEAYTDIADKQWQKLNQLEDERKLQIQYDLGLISKHDYEKTSLPFKLIAFEEKTANYMYYLKLSELEALEKGIMFAQQ